MRREMGSRLSRGMRHFNTDRHIISIAYISAFLNVLYFCLFCLFISLYPYKWHSTFTDKIGISHCIQFYTKPVQKYIHRKSQQILINDKKSSTFAFAHLCSRTKDTNKLRPHPPIIKPRRHIRRNRLRIRKRLKHLRRNLIRSRVIQRHYSIRHPA